MHAWPSKWRNSCWLRINYMKMVVYVTLEGMLLDFVSTGLMGSPSLVWLVLELFALVLLVSCNLGLDSMVRLSTAGVPGLMGVSGLVGEDALLMFLMGLITAAWLFLVGLFERGDLTRPSGLPLLALSLWSTSFSVVKSVANKRSLLMVVIGS